MPSTSKSNNPLRGLIPPVVTPLLSRDALDRPGLERLVEHLLSGGVHGLFILGTTGEGPSLSLALRQEMIQRTLHCVNDRVPVLVGVTDNCVDESIQLAQFSADAGAHAVVASAPHYFQIDQSELLGHFNELIKDLPLPLILYNMPSLTKVQFELETVAKLMSHEKVIGIKDSSGDIEYATACLKTISERPDFFLMTGPEELLADALRAGASGGVCGGANMFPKLYVDLYQAFQDNDPQLVQVLHEDILQIRQLLYSIGGHTSSIIQGIKCSLSCLGICSDFMAPPLRHFQKEERQVVQQRLQQVGQLEAKGIRVVMDNYSGS